MPYVVALTGGIASGKSTVATLFANQGAEILDADLIARQVVAPGMPALTAIAQRFGAAILQSDGTLDRQALRELIFSSPEQKVWLNQLLHPLIQQRTQQLLKASSANWCLWVVPLLVENNLQQLAQRVLVVDIPEQLQIERTMQRDKVSQQQAEAILGSQATRAQRLAVADDVIDNCLSKDALDTRVAELYSTYQQLATQRATLGL